MTEALDPLFDRPVFIVSTPRSGSTLLFETLSRARGLYTIGGESHQLIESIPALNIRSQGFSSNRLLASDATADVVAQLRGRFHAAMRDRDGQPLPAAQARFRMLEKTPKNSLRIPFLRQAFPEARWVFLYRDPRQVLGSMMEAWRSGRFKTYVGLPGWPLPYWALLLTPGWQSLAGKPLIDIVTGQWQVATDLLLDDLSAMPAGDATSIRYDAFLADPQGEMQRLCAWLGLEWDRPLEGPLPYARHTVSKPDPDKWRAKAAEIEPALQRVIATVERAEKMADALAPAIV